MGGWRRSGKGARNEEERATGKGWDGMEVYDTVTGYGWYEEAWKGSAT